MRARRLFRDRSRRMAAAALRAAVLIGASVCHGVAAARCTEAPDLYQSSGAAAALTPHLGAAVAVDPAGGTSARAQGLVARAAANASFVLSVLEFATRAAQSLHAGTLASNPRCWARPCAQ